MRNLAFFDLKVLFGLILAVNLFACSGSQKLNTDSNKNKKTDLPSVDREFRAVWIASVANINWPSSPGLSVKKQKEEAVEMLDFLVENNFNAVILQVRPQCDALYESDLEPWSYYLTGTQGQAPVPFYDPLEFWIEEAHLRGLELHAWLNPYRAHHVRGGAIGEESIVNTKKDLVVKLENGYYWMDPTDPGTQRHSFEVVMDIVNRYDVDGIHFDDYFYPYPSYNNGKDFPDDKNWNKYLGDGGKLSRADWRREAVNTFIKDVYDGIKKSKKHVKFGLSPFGIWRPDHPASIKGFDQYEELYADAKLWLNKGWIDYFTPQLYWPINKIPQSYPVLLGWWSEQNTNNRHLWPGISIHRLNNNPPGEEVINQIMIARGMLPKSPGIVHWNIGGFLRSQELTHAVLKGPYKRQALIPSSDWLNTAVPDRPTVIQQVEDEHIIINWNDEEPDISHHVIYAQYGETWTYDIVAKNALSHSIPVFRMENDSIIPLRKTAITAVNRFGTESQVIPTDVSASIQKQIPEFGLIAPLEVSTEKDEERINGIQISDQITDLNLAMEQIEKANYNAVFINSKDENKIKSIIDLARDKRISTFLVSTDSDFIELAKLNDIDGILFHHVIPDKRTLVQLSLYKPYLLYGYVGDASIDVKELFKQQYLDFSNEEPKMYIEGDSLQPVERTKFPADLKIANPEQFVGLDLSCYLLDRPEQKQIKINGNEVFLDDHNQAFLITSTTDSLHLQIGTEKLLLHTEDWSIPFKYILKKDGTVFRDSPWVEFRKVPQKNSKKENFDLLARTDAKAKAIINGQEVKVYKTGIFFDKLQFENGNNRVKAEVFFSDNTHSFYEINVHHDSIDVLRQSHPLWVDMKTLRPRSNLELTSSDEVFIQFEGSKGQEASVEFVSIGVQYPCSREDHVDSSTYSLTLPLEQVLKHGKYSILIRMNGQTVFPTKRTVTIKKPSEFPYVKTKENYTRLTYNLGPVRLGGPIRAELDQGVVLKVAGRIGNHFKVKLNETETGIVHQDAVEVLSENYNLSPYYITNILARKVENKDVIIIPYLSPVPYEIVPQSDLKRIVIRIFGAKTSSTWISHFAGLKVVDKITWQQTDPQTYEVYVNLKSEHLWGYELVKEEKSLELKIKHAPQFKSLRGKPLNGLKIAIEAGHGGKSIGSTGLSGTKEKDINLALSLLLGNILEEKGAMVHQVRASDVDLSLLEKRSIVEQSDADLFVSIHANSAGGHYLRVSGVSTYYHNPFWQPFAEKVYGRLLETGLPEFGVVGSFNYTPIRTSELPAILVEQAFLSHAEDEEKLVDPEFRKLMAQKIADGIIDYVQLRSND